MTKHQTEIDVLTEGLAEMLYERTMEWTSEQWVTWENVSGATRSHWLRIAEIEAPLLRKAAPAIDAAHLANQRAWSERTFGPGTRLLGVLDHIRKELAEIEASPTDVEEWVDVIILAFDGAWRAGWEPQQIIDAIKAKQAKNEARAWPDWRTASPDRAIEHVRTTPGGEGR